MFISYKSFGFSLGTLFIAACMSLALFAFSQPVVNAQNTPSIETRFVPGGFEVRLVNVNSQTQTVAKPRYGFTNDGGVCSGGQITRVGGKWLLWATKAKAATGDWYFVERPASPPGNFFCAQAIVTTGTSAVTTPFSPKLRSAASAANIVTIAQTAGSATPTVGIVASRGYTSTSTTYGFSTDNTCSGTEYTNGGTFTSGTAIDLVQHNGAGADGINGKFLCARAVFEHATKDRVTAVGVSGAISGVPPRVLVNVRNGGRVTVNVSDGTNTSFTNLNYGLSNDATCSGSGEFAVGTYVNGEEFIISDTFNKGADDEKRLCVQATSQSRDTIVATAISGAVADETAPTVKVALKYNFDGTVQATVTASDNLATKPLTELTYGFSDDATCEATESTTTAYTSGTAFTVASGNIGKYLCAQANDGVNLGKGQKEIKSKADLLAVNLANNTGTVSIGTSFDTLTYGFQSSSGCLNGVPESTLVGNILSFVSVHNTEYLCLRGLSDGLQVDVEAGPIQADATDSVPPSFDIVQDGRKITIENISDNVSPYPSRLALTYGYSNDNTCVASEYTANTLAAFSTTITAPVGEVGAYLCVQATDESANTFGDVSEVIEAKAPKVTFTLDRRFEYNGRHFVGVDGSPDPKVFFKYNVDVDIEDDADTTFTSITYGIASIKGVQTEEIKRLNLQGSGDYFCTTGTEVDDQGTSYGFPNSYTGGSGKISGTGNSHSFVIDGLTEGATYNNKPLCVAVTDSDGEVTYAQSGPIVFSADKPVLNTKVDLLLNGAASISLQISHGAQLANSITPSFDSDILNTHYELTRTRTGFREFTSLTYGLSDDATCTDGTERNELELPELPDPSDPGYDEAVKEAVKNVGALLNTVDEYEGEGTWGPQPLTRILPGTFGTTRFVPYTFRISDTSKFGKYLCVRGKDYLGNVVQRSVPLLVDTSAPRLQGVLEGDNLSIRVIDDIADKNWFRQNGRVAYGFSADTTCTDGTNGSTDEYSTGNLRLSVPRRAEVDADPTIDGRDAVANVNIGTVANNGQYVCLRVDDARGNRGEAIARQSFVLFDGEDARPFDVKVAEISPVAFQIPTPQISIAVDAVNITLDVENIESMVTYSYGLSDDATCTDGSNGSPNEYAGLVRGTARGIGDSGPNNLVIFGVNADIGKYLCAQATYRGATARVTSAVLTADTTPPTGRIEIRPLPRNAEGEIQLDSQLFFKVIVEDNIRASNTGDLFYSNNPTCTPRTGSPNRGYSIRNNFNVVDPLFSVRNISTARNEVGGRYICAVIQDAAGNTKTIRSDTKVELGSGYAAPPAVTTSLDGASGFSVTFTDARNVITKVGFARVRGGEEEGPFSGAALCESVELEDLELPEGDIDTAYYPSTYTFDNLEAGYRYCFKAEDGVGLQAEKQVNLKVASLADSSKTGRSANETNYLDADDFFALTPWLFRYAPVFDFDTEYASHSGPCGLSSSPACKRFRELTTRKVKRSYSFRDDYTSKTDLTVVLEGVHEHSTVTVTATHTSGTSVSKTANVADLTNNEISLDLTRKDDGDGTNDIAEADLQGEWTIAVEETVYSANTRLEEERVGTLNFAPFTVIVDTLEPEVEVKGLSTPQGAVQTPSVVLSDGEALHYARWVTVAGSDTSDCVEEPQLGSDVVRLYDGKDRTADKPGFAAILGIWEDLGEFRTFERASIYKAKSVDVTVDEDSVLCVYAEDRAGNKVAIAQPITVDSSYAYGEVTGVKTDIELLSSRVLSGSAYDSNFKKAASPQADGNAIASGLYPYCDTDLDENKVAHGDILFLTERVHLNRDNSVIVEINKLGLPERHGVGITERRLLTRGDDYIDGLESALERYEENLNTVSRIEISDLIDLSKSGSEYEIVFTFSYNPEIYPALASLGIVKSVTKEIPSRLTRDGFLRFHLTADELRGLPNGVSINAHIVKKESTVITGKGVLAQDSSHTIRASGGTTERPASIWNRVRLFFIPKDAGERTLGQTILVPIQEGEDTADVTFTWKRTDTDARNSLRVDNDVIPVHETIEITLEDSVKCRAGRIVSRGEQDFRNERGFIFGSGTGSISATSTGGSSTIINIARSRGGGGGGGSFRAPTLAVSKTLVDFITDPETQEPKIVQVVVPSVGAINRSAVLGTTGEHVRALQRFLNSKGFTVSTTGFGSAGQETVYFGTKTRQALIRYQQANGLVASGNLDNTTLASIQKEAPQEVAPTPTIEELKAQLKVLQEALNNLLAQRRAQQNPVVSPNPIKTPTPIVQPTRTLPSTNAPGVQSTVNPSAGSFVPTINTGTPNFVPVSVPVQQQINVPVQRIINVPAQTGVPFNDPSQFGGIQAPVKVQSVGAPGR